jgi:hypothetical protein
MLNEWSDRDPKPPKRGVFGSSEFWLGVFSTIVMLAILVGSFAGRL